MHIHPDATPHSRILPSLRTSVCVHPHPHAHLLITCTRPVPCISRPGHLAMLITHTPRVVHCLLLSRPVLPDRELTKGGSAITSGCQQRARAMKLRYVAWWWRSRERKPTGFGSGFGRCLASVSTSRQGSEKNPKGSGSGTRSRRDRENEGQRYGKYLS